MPEEYKTPEARSEAQISNEDSNPETIINHFFGLFDPTKKQKNIKKNNVKKNWAAGAVNPPPVRPERGGLTMIPPLLNNGV